jgi:cytochrome b561
MQTYSRTAIALHWLLALLIIANFALGVTMVDISGLTPAKLQYFAWHKWLGIAVLALTAYRFLWRLSQDTPRYPIGIPAWQEQLAGALHRLMYMLMFAVPLSGYLYTTAAGVPVVFLGLLPIPAAFGPDAALKAIFKTAHYALNMGLLAGVCLHISAALKHHFIERDNILRRMFP